MDINILNLISLANVIVFVSLIFFTKIDRNKFYILYILLSYPLLSNYAAPSINTFVLITLIFISFFYKRKNIKNYNPPFYKQLVYILICSILIGFMLSGAIIDRDKFIYISEITALFLFAGILIDELQTDELFFFRIIKYIKITLIVSFIFLIIQFIFGPEVSLSRTMNPNIITTNSIRYPSFLSDPQTYAQFLGICCFICLIKDNYTNKHQAVNYILILFTLVAILVTGGRAGLTGLIIGYLFLILLSNYRLRYLLIFFAIVCYFVAIKLKDNLAIFNRGNDISDTYDFRYSIWMDALEIFKQFPLFGIGIGNYSKYASMHNPDQFWIVENEIVYFDHPESGYLKLLTEFGLIGFICILSIFLLPVIISIKNYLINKNYMPVILSSCIICWMIGFYSTFSFGDIRIAILVTTILCMLIVQNSNKFRVRSISISNV